ncbi:MAG: M24 family metallopeptidase, partial [Myxococcota bacterium]
MRVQIKQPWELAVMRANGRRLAEVGAMLRDAISAGVTTRDLDRMALDLIQGMGAHPSFLNYAPAGMPPFPGTICASVNDVVVHGVPNDEPLVDG